jgi:hypothetical protein
MMADSVFGTDLGGTGKQQGSQLPNIGDTPDEAVAEDRPGPTADGEPVSPYLAARRYGAAAGQGYRGINVDPGAP